MSEEQRSFWQRLFGRGGGSSLSQRQQKVLGYMIGRLNKDVRRNCSAQELEQIVSNLEFVQAARARLGSLFARRS